MWSWNMFNLLLFTEFIKEKYLDWMRKKPATFLQWYSWNREYKILYYLDKQRTTTVPLKITSSEIKPRETNIAETKVRTLPFDLYNKQLTSCINALNVVWLHRTKYLAINIKKWVKFTKALPRKKIKIYFCFLKRRFVSCVFYFF